MNVERLSGWSGPPPPRRTASAEPRVVTSDELASRCRLVTLEREATDLAYFPDYLVIGPQRTGTTWLHKCIEKLPGFLTSKPKEVHYFNRLQSPSHPSFRSSDLDWYMEHFRRVDRAGERAAEVKGESTASYSLLADASIADIVYLNPDIRVVMGIRDPVERTWSHAKLELIRHQGIDPDALGFSEIKDFFQRDNQIERADYATVAERWTAHLKAGHFGVFFFKDISDDPQSLIEGIARFLGAAPDAGLPDQLLRKRVNPSVETPLPPEQYEELAAIYRAAIARNLEFFGPDIAERW